MASGMVYFLWLAVLNLVDEVNKEIRIKMIYLLSQMKRREWWVDESIIICNEYESLWKFCEYV